ncbi:MAG: hypothetical protein GY801_43540 [bacterium]|nr:hypothetical protein [bacterium]
MLDFKRFFLLSFCLLLTLTISACSSTHRDLALQSAALVLSYIEVRPSQVNPGGTVVLDIGLASISENLREGQVIVTDSQGNTYQEGISNMKEALSSSLVSSFRLSPLIPSGEMLLQVFVLDSEGNSSNTGFVTITVL